MRVEMIHPDGGTTSLTPEENTKEVYSEKSILRHQRNRLFYRLSFYIYVFPPFLHEIAKDSQPTPIHLSSLAENRFLTLKSFFGWLRNNTRANKSAQQG